MPYELYASCSTRFDLSEENFQREIFGNQSRVGYSGAGCAQSRVRVAGRPAFDVERAEIIWELKSRLINKD
jgi:hypothetical protein